VTQIYEYPRAWYQFISSSFNLATYTLKHASQFRARRSARTIEQVFEAQFTQKPERGPTKWQGKSAFFSRLEGDTNLIRIGDPLRCVPLYNRAPLSGAGEPFSDDTFFTDGYGWYEDGMVPEFAYLTATGRRGDSSVIIGGLPVNKTSPFLNKGDLFEIRPNGIPAATGMLYEIQVPAGTDSEGRSGVEIRPRLRQPVAVSDQIVFWFPQTVMRLIDPNSAAMSRESNRGAFGFTCMEETP
jgi:hypothetical protein